MFDVAQFANALSTSRPVARRQPSQITGCSVGEASRRAASEPLLSESEPHSRSLPFMGWLPNKWQRRYWKLARVSWEHDFYVVTIKHLKQTAQRAGFDVAHVRNFNYPPEVIPSSVRWAARLLERPMRYMPWSWQFVLVRPA